MIAEYWNPNEKIDLEARKRQLAAQCAPGTPVIVGKFKEAKK